MLSPLLLPLLLAILLVPHIEAGQTASLPEDCRDPLSGYDAAATWNNERRHVTGLLIDIYNDLNGLGWTKGGEGSDTSWSTMVECQRDPCNLCQNYHGILCNSDGSILSINLSNNNLRPSTTGENQQGDIGQLLSLASQLPDLRNLDIHGNSLTGTLDRQQTWGGGESWVWTLGTDMSIDVSNNDLHGRIDAYSSTGCSLRVANNRFTEISDNTLSAFKGPVIDLSGNLFSNWPVIDLTGNTFNNSLIIPDTWFLEELKLKNNKFSGTLLPATLFSDHPDLLNVTLEGNSFTGSLPGVNTTSDVTSSLELLTMQDNDFDEIPDSLGRKRFPKLKTLDARNNKLTGDLPPTLTDLCFEGDTKCNFIGNKLMCGDRERMFSTACAPCDICTTEGECHDGFDDSDYMCFECPVEHYEINGVCVACNSVTPSSIVFLSLLGAAVLFVSVLNAVRYRQGKELTIPSFELGLKNQIRIKQVSTIMQMTGLLSVLYFPTPAWYNSMSNFFDSLSLPITPTVPCVGDLQSLERYQLGLMTAGFLLIMLLLALFASRILKAVLPADKYSRIDSKVFFNLQVLAGITVTQSVLIFLTMVFSTRGFKGKSIEAKMATESEAPRLESEADASYQGGLITSVALVAIAIAIVKHGSSVFIEERRKFLAADSTESSSSSRLTEQAQLDSLLPFWSTFTIAYTPSCSDHEYYALTRKVLTAIFPPLVDVAAFNALSSSKMENLALIPLIASCVDAIFFVTIQTMYMKSLLERPYVSFRASAKFGDPFNDVEILATRVLCWTVFLLVVGAYTESSAFTSVVCVGLILALANAHRPLFVGSLEGILPGKEKTGKVEGSAVSEIVEEMMDTTSARDMFLLHERMKAALASSTLHETEQARWEARTDGSAGSGTGAGERIKEVVKEWLLVPAQTRWEGVVTLSTEEGRPKLRMAVNAAERSWTVGVWAAKSLGGKIAAGVVLAYLLITLAINILESVISLLGDSSVMMWILFVVLLLCMARFEFIVSKSLESREQDLEWRGWAAWIEDATRETRRRLIGHGFIFPHGGRGKRGEEGDKLELVVN